MCKATAATVIFLVDAPSKTNSDSQLALYRTKIKLNVLGLALFLERRLEHRDQTLILQVLVPSLSTCGRSDRLLLPVIFTVDKLRWLPQETNTLSTAG